MCKYSDFYSKTYTQTALLLRLLLILSVYQIRNILQLVVAVELYLLIDGIALDEVLLEDGGRPTTKLYTLLTLDSISNRDDNIKIVKRNGLVRISNTQKMRVAFLC